MHELPPDDVLEPLFYAQVHRSQSLRDEIAHFDRLKINLIDTIYILDCRRSGSTWSTKRRIETRDALHRSMLGYKAMMATGSAASDCRNNGANNEKGVCRNWTRKGTCPRVRTAHVHTTKMPERRWGKEQGTRTNPHPRTTAQAREARVSKTDKEACKSPAQGKCKKGDQYEYHRPIPCRNWQKGQSCRVGEQMPLRSHFGGHLRRHRQEVQRPKFFRKEEREPKQDDGDKNPCTAAGFLASTEVSRSATRSGMSL